MIHQAIIGSYTAIVADDSDLARSRLVCLLRENYSNIEIVGEASDGVDALELINTLKPDLAFLDIEMPGMSGIDAAVTADHKPFVVFITGHIHYIKDSYKALTVDFILKPITAEALVAAVEKFTVMIGRKEVMQISDANNKSSSPIKSEYLKVTFGDSIKFIPFVEIICCEANARYSTVFTLTDQFVSEKSLSELQGIFPPETFFRIHRKHIVNFSFVRELKRAGDRTYSVVLKFPFDKQLVVSREFRDQLQGL